MARANCPMTHGSDQQKYSISFKSQRLLSIDFMLSFVDLNFRVNFRYHKDLFDCTLLILQLCESPRRLYGHAINKCIGCASVQFKSSTNIFQVSFFKNNGRILWKWLIFELIGSK